MFFLALLMLTTLSYAQSPEKISYQAVIRDVSNELVSEQDVGIQIRILQGIDPATATTVYVETQSTRTNVNGLLSFEIGTGNSTNDFSVIDWSSGTYYLETNIDPSGGTDYSVKSTSQLMSVPYAMYAKTAERVLGSVNYTETDPEFTAWDKSSGIIISESQISDLNVLEDTKLTEQEVVEFITDNGFIKNTVNGQLKSLSDPTDAQDAATKAYVDALEAKITLLQDRIISVDPRVGDSYLGGVVFYIFQPGDLFDYVDGEVHGLVCAFEDQNPVQWGCYQTNLPSVIDVSISNYVDDDIAYTAEIGIGSINTNNILNDCPDSPAASEVRVLGDDWFLPSLKEIKKMYENKDVLEGVPGFSALLNFYWSST